MASWSEMSSGARTTAVAVVALLLGGGGYGLWRANQPEPVAVASGTEEAAPAASTTEPAATAEAPKDAPAETMAEPAAEPTPTAEPAPATEPAPVVEEAPIEQVRSIKLRGGGEYALTCRVYAAPEVEMIRQAEAKRAELIGAIRLRVVH